VKALFFFSSLFRHLACILFFLTLVVSSNAQKQLVFIRHGKVVSRFTIGSPIRLKLKNHQYKEGRIVELNDFSMVTSNDTIKFQSIAKLHSKHIHQVRVNSGIGGLLFVGGLGYIAIDQLNASLGYNKSGWDQTDQKALVAAGVGAALLFIRPRYTRLPPGTAIRVVDYTSLFYLIP
jgi:hypothetical protein